SWSERSTLAPRMTFDSVTKAPFMPRAISLTCLFTVLGCLSSAWPQAAKVAEKRSPAEAAQSFTVAEGLRFDQVLSEPNVRQPIALTFDERGHLRGGQYL